MSTIEDEQIQSLEFFSGIGGLHHGLEFSLHPKASVIASFDINPVANAVITHNFGVAATQLAIESISPARMDKFGANCWLMSPPCQPYTRGGRKLDDQDLRAKGLLHLVALLPKLKNPPKYIFLENVLNFEVSRSRDLLLQALTSLNYDFDEWMLTPTQFGIPNDRKRYYLTARRRIRGGLDDTTQTIEFVPEPPALRLRREWPESLPPQTQPPPLAEFLEEREIQGGITPHLPSAVQSQADWSRTGKYLGGATTEQSHGDEEEDDEDENDTSDNVSGAGEPRATAVSDDMYKVPEAFVKTRKSISASYVVSPNDRECPCFTKAYGHHGIGAGAFLQTKALEGPRDLSDPLTAAETLGLRFFTPTEIARLHAFPIDRKAPKPLHFSHETHTLTPFSFPDSHTLIQKYRLLGNSLNVKVVGDLLRWVLFNEDWNDWLGGK